MVIVNLIISIFYWINTAHTWTTLNEPSIPIVTFYAEYAIILPGLVLDHDLYIYI